MLQRTFPAGFIAPCLPTKAHKPPSGGQWLHEIKHDGFRIIARAIVTSAASLQTGGGVPL
jgi:ATP-dependent DNA ligase